MAVYKTKEGREVEIYDDYQKMNGQAKVLYLDALDRYRPMTKQQQRECYNNCLKRFHQAEAYLKRDLPKTKRLLAEALLELLIADIDALTKILNIKMGSNEMRNGFGRLNSERSYLKRLQAFEY